MQSIKEPEVQHQAILFAPIPISQDQYHFIESGYDVSVMSFNILANKFFRNPQKKDPNSFFNINNRSKCVVETIKQANPDICILQELDYKKFYLQEFSKLGYGYSIKNRIEGPDSIAILYKKHKFSMVNSQGINFNENHPFQNQKKYSQQNVGLCIELIHSLSKKKVVVLGCHMFPDPNLEQVKYLQTMICLDYLQSRYKKDEIIFWGGDFNSKPNDNNINYMYSRMEPEFERIEKAKETIMVNQLEIYECYKDKNKFNQIDFVNLYSMYGLATGHEEIAFPKYTNYKSNFKETLDYIFFKSGSALPISLLAIDEVGIEKNKGLPAEGFPSDHVPIMGNFLI